MIFKIQTERELLHPVTFCINYYKLNIRIIEVINLPTPKPEGDPDIEIIMDLLSQDLAEVFLLGHFSGKQKTSYHL